MNKNGEKLDKYCLVSSGGTPSKKNLFYYENGSILWATIADMEKSDGIVLDTKLKITEKGLSSIGNRIFPKDTLFLAMYGSVGKVAIAGKEMAVNQAILGIQPKNENEIFIPYLKYWLMHNKPKIVNKARGGILKNLSAKIVKNIKIELPSYSDQKKIANLLTQVETLIAKREESIGLLDELLRSSFLDMFGDPVLNSKGWDKKTCIDVASCLVPTRDKPKSFSGGIPWITTNNLIDKGRIKIDRDNYLGLSKEEMKQVKVRIIPKGSVIFTCVGDLGIVSINDEDIVMNQQLHSFQCFDEVNNVFMMFNISFQKRYMYKYASKTTVPYMNKTTCNKIPIILPPKPLQDKFATIVKQVESTKEQYQKSLDELRDLFGSLSQRAFRGELKLKDKKKVPALDFKVGVGSSISNVLSVGSKIQGVGVKLPKLGNLNKIIKYSSPLEKLAVSNSITGIGSIGTKIDFIKTIGLNLPSMGTKLSPLLKMNSFGNKMNTVIGNHFLTKEKLNRKLEELELIICSVPNLNDAFNSKILSMKDFGELYIDATYDDIKELVYKLLDEGKLEQLFDEDKKRVVLKKVKQ